jgi:hypothetical protein
VFQFFDADRSGELDEAEFRTLLNQIFPDRCEENEAAVATEFAAADTDGSAGVSFTEFCAYYDRLRSLYGDTPPQLPPQIAEARKPPVPAPAAAPAASTPKRAKSGGLPAPKRGGAKKGGAAKKAAAPDSAPALGADAHARLAQLEELLTNGLISQAEYDAKRASIIPIQSELVECACGERFLHDVLARHQRSCASVSAVKKTVRFVAQPPTPPQDPLSSDVPCTPAPVEKEVTSIEYANNGANSFVACEACGRTFFPDRLAIHQRVCKGRKPLSKERRAQLDELLENGLITQAEYDEKLQGE